MPFTFHLYLLQTASMNSCLFSAYPTALMGKIDSQEDAPFSITSFMSCCDSTVSYPKSSSHMSHILAFYVLLPYSAFRVSGILLV